MAGLIHIGANDASELIGSSYSPMILIEPQLAAFGRLEQNFKDRDDVHCVRCAIGSEMKWVTLNTAIPDYSSSLLKPKEHLELMPEIIFEGTEEVRMYPLDALMQYLPGEYDTLIVDVQGYELEALRGATETLKSINRIKIEVNISEVYENCTQMHDLDDFLVDFDRVGTDLYGGVWGDAGYERKA